MLLIPPRPFDLGDGFQVNRVLPFAKKRMVGPFIFWDHMGPVPLTTGEEMVVRPHPHIGLATLTYLFEGAIFHRDSLGNELAIRPGEVNWMIAGKGIVHSERSGPLREELKGGRIHGIQLWIALPKEHEEVPPSFHHFGESEIPAFTVGDHQIRLVAGEAFGQSSPVPVHSPLFYLEAKLAKGAFSFPLPKRQEAAVYIVSGRVKIAGQEVLPKTMAVFSLGDQIEISIEEQAQVMILGGEPLPEDRHIWWNFVHSSKDRIEEAKKDWAEGRFGKVVNEGEDFIPLPKN